MFLHSLSREVHLGQCSPKYAAPLVTAAGRQLLRPQCGGGGGGEVPGHP